MLGAREMSGGKVLAVDGHRRALDLAA